MKLLLYKVEFMNPFANMLLLFSRVVAVLVDVEIEVVAAPALLLLLPPLLLFWFIKDVGSDKRLVLPLAPETSVVQNVGLNVDESNSPIC